MRGQGTLEYLLLLGGAILVTTLALIMLTASAPTVEEAKLCVVKARSSLSCFYSNGSFNPDAKFEFSENKIAHCNCSLFFTIASSDSVSSTPTPTPTPMPTPSASPTVTPTPTPTPPLPSCAGTGVSCGAPGACQACASDQTCINNICTLKPGCQYNNPACPEGQICQNNVCVLAKDLAIVVKDTKLLSEEEQAVENIIREYSSVGVTRVKELDATYEYLKQFKSVAITDYLPALTAANINALIETDGKNILLFHDALKIMVPGAQSDKDGQIGVNSNTRFLEKYDAGGCNSNKIIIQDATRTYFYSGGGVSGWEPLSEAWCNWRYNVFAKQTATTKSAIFGYDPAALNDEGKITADQIVRWALGITTASQTVTQNKAALITQSYDASTLTPQEQGLKTELEKQGVSVELVPQRRRFTADYSKASMVIQAHSPGFKLAGFYQKLSSEKNTLVAYQGLQIFVDARTEAYDAGDIGVGNNKYFFENYDAGGCNSNKIIIQEAAKNYYYSEGGIGGWETLSEAWCRWRYNTFAKQTATVRSVAFGYDPSALTNEGKIMVQQIIQWITRNAPKTNVPDGTVALITKDYAANPVLSPQEQAVEDLLKRQGLPVLRVSQSQRFNTDFTKAALVTTAHSPNFKLAGFYQKLSENSNTIVWHEGFRLFNDAAAANDANGEIGIMQRQAYLQNYDAKGCGQNKIKVQDGSTYYYSGGGITGWQVLGEAWCNWRYDAFYKQSASIRSAVFGYDPSKLTDEGKIMADELLRWIRKDSSYALTVPQGQAALLTKSYQPGGGLTTDEAFLKQYLQQMGLTVMEVPQSLRFKTDFSKAVFVAIVEPLGFSLNYLTEFKAVPRLLLIGQAIALPQPSSAKDSQTSVYTWSDAGFLTGYPKGTHIGVQDTPTTAYYHGGGMPGWTTALETSTFSWSYTGFFANPASSVCGAAWGYLPKNLNAKGKLMLSKMAQWLYHQCYLSIIGQPPQTQTAEYTAHCQRKSSGNQNNLFVCSGSCSDTVNIPISDSIHEYVYKAEFVDYYMDDLGPVNLNGVTLVNKDRCCNGDKTVCDGGADHPGSECKGGCTWTGTDWFCGLIDNSRACTRPSRVSVMDLLQSGGNVLSVQANDAIYGEPIGNEGKATVRVYKQVD